MTVFAPEVLPWLLLIPFIGGLLAWQTERISAALPRWIALITMLIFFVITCLLWLQGGYSGGAVVDAIGAERTGIRLSPVTTANDIVDAEIDLGCRIRDCGDHAGAIG